MNNATEPAFPFTWVDKEGWETIQSGLTKREYFAAMYMQGLAMNNNNKWTLEQKAKESLTAADKLLKQLSNEINS